MNPTPRKTGRGAQPRKYSPNVLKKYSGQQMSPLEAAVTLGLSLAGVYLLFRAGMPKVADRHTGAARIDADQATEWLRQNGRIK